MGRKDFIDKEVKDKDEKDEKDEKETDEKDINYNDMLTSMKSSQIFYPIMQCADIFFLNIDICSLGKDQRKVNMLAIEYCDMIKRKLKPIIVSHHMLQGLDGSDKMAKSNPDAAIFMDDTDQEIKTKIKKAFCEPGNITKNPILEYYQYIVFEKESEVGINVYNPETKSSVLRLYYSFEELQKDFQELKVYPNDLKDALEQYLKKYLDPVREYFVKNMEAETLRKEVKKFVNNK
jgi:tyrosyl-tRNA synthetase